MVSIAWFKRDEVGADLDSDEICSAAFPFDQGVENKPWYQARAQLTLFGGSDEVNLPRLEWRKLWEWVIVQRLEVVMHNAMHDIPLIEAGTRQWAGFDLLPQLYWDTMLGAREFWPHLFETALAKIGPKVLGDEAAKDAKPVKEWIRKNKRKYTPMGYPTDNGGYDIVPWEIIRPYADADARDTLGLFARQKAEFDAGFIWAGHWTETMDKLRLMIEVAGKGLPYDTALSREQSRQAAQRQRVLEKSLPFPPTTPAATHYFFGEGKTGRGVDCLGLPPIAVTEKGAPQLTAAILEQLAGEGVAHAPQWRDWSKLKTARSMWWDGFSDKVGADGRLRMKYKLDGTKNGRFSAERVNLQAIPQDFNIQAPILEGLATPRRCISSALGKIEGWTFIEFDLAQAELRVASLMAKCKTMLEMINNGDDLHSETAKFLFKVGPDHPRWKRYRSIGKRGNFSLIFDCGPETFRLMLKNAEGIELPPKEAKQIVYAWKERYWEFKRAVDRESTFVGRNKWTQMATGRRRWFAPMEDWHSAFNAKVQGSIGQMVGEWLLAVDEVCRKMGIQERADREGIGKAGILLTVHDSIGVLMPVDTEHELCEEIVHAGLRIWDELFPGVPGGVDAKAWD